MFSACELSRGDRFIPLCECSKFGNDQHYVFLCWIQGQAIGYFHGRPELGLIALHVFPDTQCLLARPVHHTEPLELTHA